MAEREVEFGVEIGEYRGVVTIPRRVFQRLLPERGFRRRGFLMIADFPISNLITASPKFGDQPVIRNVS